MTGRQKVVLRRDGSFDALETAARGLELAGSAKAADLPRVTDQLADEEDDESSEITWRITGTTDALGRSALEVSLDGAVTLECQRCLRPFAWPVAQRTLLLLARDEREQAILDEDDEHEVVVAAASLDPRVLVEDELLLTLPFAPHCERGDCVTAGLQDDRGAGSKAAETSPFGALATLKSAPVRKPKA
ncbi:MAG: YceD family protein [Casimicrobiaceae bacterium]